MRCESRSHCDTKCDAAGIRIRQHGAARNDRTRCHHSGCSGIFETCVSYQNWPAARGRVKKAALAMDGSAAVNCERQDAADKQRKNPPVPGWPGGRKLAATGREQPSSCTGESVVVRSCDVKCDAISPDRVELLARAVILVAGMAIPEMGREAVLARVVADLTAQGDRTRGEGKGSRHAASRMMSRYARQTRE